MGDCRNSFSESFQSPDLASPDFFKADFLTFFQKSGSGGRPTNPDFWPSRSRFPNCPDFLPSYSSAMDADSQARGGRVGRSGGVPNYKNDILIDVVELYLPRGLEAWREVALAYQRESMETVLRRGGDLRDNRMQKPKGKPGVLSDRRSYLPMH